jgi:hypothetical protein
MKHYYLPILNYQTKNLANLLILTLTYLKMELDRKLMHTSTINRILTKLCAQVPLLLCVNI